jgi:hypothetical protein
MAAAGTPAVPAATAVAVEEPVAVVAEVTDTR